MIGHAPGALITGKEPSPDPAACPRRALPRQRGRRCKGERDLGSGAFGGRGGREDAVITEEEARMDGACASSGPEAAREGDPQAHVIHSPTMV